MLTQQELAITIFALVGAAFNAAYFVCHESDHKRFALRVVFYALLVLTPTLFMHLWAFIHFWMD